MGAQQKTSQSLIQKLHSWLPPASCPFSSTILGQNLVFPQNSHWQHGQSRVVLPGEEQSCLAPVRGQSPLLYSLVRLSSPKRRGPGGHSPSSSLLSPVISTDSDSEASEVRLDEAAEVTLACLLPGSRLTQCSHREELVEPAEKAGGPDQHLFIPQLTLYLCPEPLYMGKAEPSSQAHLLGTQCGHRGVPSPTHGERAGRFSARVYRPTTTCNQHAMIHSMTSNNMPDTEEEERMALS